MLGIPLSILWSFVIYAFVAWVKSCIVKRKAKQEEKKYEKILKNLKFGEADRQKKLEALKRFHQKQADEERLKIQQSKGKTLFDEVEERYFNKNKSSAKSAQKKYTPEMFEDVVTKLYNEKQRRKQAQLDLHRQQEQKF